MRASSRSVIFHALRDTPSKHSLATRSSSLRASTLSFLLPSFNKALRRGIADQDSVHVRLQQVIQPGRPGAFFPGDMQFALQSGDKLQNTAGFGFDDRLHHPIPLVFRTAITIASLCTSIPIYLTSLLI